jgi:hypothetical protein
VLQHQTQTAAFWRDQFEVTTNDADFLYTLLLDAQTAKPLADLAVALIQEYMRREHAKIEAELAKGTIYLPKSTYQVGQTLVFPALDFATGEVVNIRPGQNPEHGKFDVIKVRFNSNGTREYAAGLQTGHSLNQSSGRSLTHDETQLSAAEIYALYGAEIDESILYALEEGERSSQFVQVDGAWLLADMLAEVHAGHLNIAEALVEMNSAPLTTEQLLAEVELDANVGKAMQRVSLEHALARDERFDRVEREGKPAWFLRRMEPAEVVQVPAALRAHLPRYNRALLSVELLQNEWELDDEWGESTLSSELPTIVPNTSLTLIYPHRRHGTLPLNGRTRGFFPAGQGNKATVTLIDGRWGGQYTGWVVYDGRYVTGLSKWMDDHALPVGAIVTLERTPNANEIVVDFRTRRPKREWARIATPDLEHQRLTFEMNKIQVAAEYDETMIVADNDPAAIDELRARLAGVELAALVDQIVPELTKLNPQGTAHAKSIYSAVNIVRRCPPGPIFYELVNNRRFRDVGGGLFALA